MKIKKKILIYLLFMCICPMFHSQDKVTYGYDAAGNRISRTIVMGTKSSPTTDEEEHPAVYTEKVADIILKIYPNPTDGLVKVEIYNLPEGQTANIWLYAMTGRLINTFKGISDAVSINIGKQPEGVYVMKIEAGEYRTEWKIIKK
jgi:hypothetical protein